MQQVRRKTEVQNPKKTVKKAPAPVAVQKTDEPKQGVMPESPFGPLLLRVMVSGPMGFLLAAASVSDAEEKKVGAEKQSAPEKELSAEEKKKQAASKAAQCVATAGLAIDDVVQVAMMAARSI